MSSRVSAFTFIKENVDILDYLESVVESVKRDGHSRARCKCPIHGGSNPTSMSVDGERGVFICHACGAQGSVIDLYAGINNRDPRDPELLADMARDFRLKLPKQERKKAVTVKQIHRALGDIANRCTDSLCPENGEPAGDAYVAHAYMHSRTFINPDVEDAMPEHGIGFLDRETLKSIREDYPAEVLEAAGFLRPRGTGFDYYCPIVGRLTFPIYDADGNVIAISGRIVPAFTADDGEMLGPIDTILDGKYVNPVNGTAYDKSRDLYDFDKIIPDKITTCIVTEGYLDAFAINASITPFINRRTAAVALCGTALSNTHAERIAENADVIVFMTDGDTAGNSSMFNSAWIGYEYPDVRVFAASHLLPDGEDPFDVVCGTETDAHDLDDVIKRSRDTGLGRYAIEAKFEALGDDTQKFYRWCKSIYRRITHDEGHRNFIKDVSYVTGIASQVVAVEISSGSSSRRREDDKNITDISDINVSPTVISLVRFIMGISSDSLDMVRLRHSYTAMGPLADVTLKRWFGFSEDYETEAFRCAVMGDVAVSQEAAAILTDAISSSDSGKVNYEPIARIVKNSVGLMNREDVVKLNRSDFSIVWSMVSKFVRSANLAKRPSEAIPMLCAALEMGAGIMNILIELDDGLEGE